MTVRHTRATREDGQACNALAIIGAPSVPGFRWRPDPERPKAMNLDAVRRTALAVSEQGAEALRTKMALLVLGGDCTVELGTVAGAERDGPSMSSD